MILYTPIASEDIYPQSDETFSNRHCVSYQGRNLYVEQLNDGSYELLQLLSTDPEDFLNTSYVPGTIIPR
jgi:hypothetical protein